MKRILAYIILVVLSAAILASAAFIVYRTIVDEHSTYHFIAKYLQQ